MRPCATCKKIEDEGFAEHPHCEKCHRSWRGHAEEHCDSCCRHFGGDVAFMAHLADGTCRDPSILVTEDKRPRFRLITRKHSGSVWVQNDPRLYPEPDALGDDSQDASEPVGAAL